MWISVVGFQCGLVLVLVVFERQLHGFWYGSAMEVCDFGLDWWWVGDRHGKSVGSGRLIGLRVKTGHFKRVKKGSSQSGCGSGRVELTRIFHMNFFYYKENNIYLPFGKSCNKLLDVNFEFTALIKNELS